MNKFKLNICFCICFISSLLACGHLTAEETNNPLNAVDRSQSAQADISTVQIIEKQTKHLPDGKIQIVELKQYYQFPDRYRMENEDTLIIVNGTKKIVYNKDAKKYSIGILKKNEDGLLSKDRIKSENILNKFKRNIKQYNADISVKCIQGKYKDTDTNIIDCWSPIIEQNGQTLGPFHVQIFTDITTKETIAVSYDRYDPSNTTILVSTDLSEYVYNQTLSADLFEFTPPTDATDFKSEVTQNNNKDKNSNLNKTDINTDGKILDKQVIPLATTVNRNSDTVQNISVHWLQTRKLIISHSPLLQKDGINTPASNELNLLHCYRFGMEINILSIINNVLNTENSYNRP